MDIVMVAHDWDIKIGKGITRYAQELYKHLSKKHNIELIFRNDFAKKGDIKTIQTSSTFVPLLSKKYIHTIREKAKKSDIVHFVSPGTVPVFMKKEFPSVTTFHDLDPIIFTRYLYQFPFSYMSKIYAYLWWRKVAIKSSVLISVSTQTREEIKKYFGKESIVINNGVDEKFRPKPDVKKEFDILFFHSDMYRKRGYFVNYLSDEFKILVAGGESKKKSFSKYATIKPRKNITQIGYVDEEKIVDVYNSAKIFFFPSIQEGFGLPIIEAVRCGLPTITFENACIPKEVKRLTLKAKDIKDAIDIIRWLLDKDTYKEIGEGFRKMSLNKFSWKECAKKTEEVYKKYHK